jgi:hypothetical protein
LTVEKIGGGAQAVESTPLESNTPRRMESFLNTMGQHVSSYINLRLMKQIDTGDRMTDTAIQMIATTVIGALITYMITLYTKGLWKDHYRRFEGLLSTSEYDPLDFDPTFAPEKPQNGKNFLFRSQDFSSNHEHVVTWFYKYHSGKKYKLSNETLNREMIVPAGSTILSNEPLNNVTRRGFVVSGNIPIWRSRDGSYVYITTHDEQASEYLILISDSAMALKECTEHIEKYAEKAAEIMSSDSGSAQKLYEILGDNNREFNGFLSKNKTFDTLFFTQKQQIMGLLQKFKDGCLVPKHLPLENKLGIILHGPPGTGKTGFISALANFLKKDVLLVDMTKIKTQKALNWVLMDANHKIIVFEEFDCMEGVHNRSLEKESGSTRSSETSDPNSAIAMMVMANNKEFAETYKKERAEAKNKLDLGYLLRKIDGLESAEGRVLIATTNHPERIDPALLRPGRFGIQLNLGNATHQMIRDIVGMVYQQAITDEQVSEIPEGVWSPAEILQRGLQYPDTAALLESLKSPPTGWSSETSSVCDV